MNTFFGKYFVFGILVQDLFEFLRDKFTKVFRKIISKNMIHATCPLYCHIWLKKSDAKNIALVSTTYVRTYLLIKVKKPKKKIK